MKYNNKLENLQQIGRYFGTDKHDENHSFAEKSYLHIYDNYLSDLRRQDVNFLELGVKDGQSHRMWSKYFSSNSKIYGVDIDPRCSKFSSNNIKIFIGSQADKDISEKILKDCHGKLDVVLDDASHINHLTISSFNLYWPKLKNGGLYIIEDLGCSYLEEDTQEHVNKWPGMKYNNGLSEFVNKREDLNVFFNSIIEKLDKEQTEDIEWVHFYSKICIIKKQGKNHV